MDVADTASAAADLDPAPMDGQQQLNRRVRDRSPDSSARPPAGEECGPAVSTARTSVGANIVCDLRSSVREVLLCSLSVGALSWA